MNKDRLGSYPPRWNITIFHRQNEIDHLQLEHFPQLQLLAEVFLTLFFFFFDKMSWESPEHL